VRIFTDDIRMEFGLSKCAMIVLKRGKLVQSDGIKMPDGEMLKSLEEGDNYKYLGVLEADTIKHQTMKETVRKEYLRRVRKVLGSKLNGGNIITAINSRAVSIIRYGAGVLEWTQAELAELDRKTRKLLTMYNAHHPKANVDRLYLKRSTGGRGLISVDNCVEMEKCSLSKYLENSSEPLLKAAAAEGVLKSNKELKDKAAIQEERTISRSEKSLHSQFDKATEQVRGERSWDWLKKGALKKETESTIIAAQDQAITTNNIRKIIYKENVSSLCRMCGKYDETIAHITSECPKLAQNEYKTWRHDQVARVIHWKLCEKWGFEKGETWYKHTPEKVLENEECKLLWDFSIQTDKKLEHNKPDITVVDKKSQTTLLIDPACPFDFRIDSKEQQKLDYYNPLKFEIAKLWKQKKVIVIPIVIGALGTVSKKFESWVKMTGVDCPVELLQKACLLGTARILRKVLSC